MAEGNLTKLSEQASAVLTDIDNADAYLLCALYQTHLRRTTHPTALCRYQGGGWAQVKFSAMSLTKRKVRTKDLRYILRAAISKATEA